MDVLIFLLAICVACGFFGRYISAQKIRSPTEGWWIGFVLGPIGLLIVALLPTLDPPQPTIR